MDEETDGVLQNKVAARELDAIDRKILGVLVEDATISYAELGERVCLSPPAAHERVKRLRRSGAIRSTAVIIEPKAVKKPLLAFVHVDTSGWGKTPELMAISDFPEGKLDEEITLPFGGGMTMTMADLLGLPYWNTVYHLGQINQIQLMLGDREMH